NEHFQVELLPLAAHQIGDTGLSNPQALSCLYLCETFRFDVGAKVAHELGPHLKHCCLGGLETEVEEDIISGLLALLSHVLAPRCIAASPKRCPTFPSFWSSWRRRAARKSCRELPDVFQTCANEFHFVHGMQYISSSII